YLARCLPLQSSWIALPHDALFRKTSSRIWRAHPLVLRLGEASHGMDSSGGPGRLEPQVVSAYILTQTEVGQADSVAKDVAGIKGVGLAEAVAGPYDVIAQADASRLDMLA